MAVHLVVFAVPLLAGLFVSLMCMPAVTWRATTHRESSEVFLSVNHPIKSNS